MPQIFPITKPIELPEEVWRLILGRLHRPLPSPTGDNPRGLIRQPELAKCMSVNKLLNNLTAPFLYTNVVSDALPILLYNFGRPSCSSGIQSKLQLLQYTKRLLLEYGDKSDPSYYRLMNEGRNLFPLLHAPTDDDIKAVCQDESAGIETSCTLLTRHLLVQRPCNLGTVATGAFVDGQTALWERLYHSEPSMMLNSGFIARASRQLSQLIVFIENSVSCQRVECGPLTLPQLLWKERWRWPNLDAPRSRYSHRSHVEARGRPFPAGQIVTVTGGSSRWYLPWDPLPGPHGAQKGLFHLKELVRRALWVRTRSLKDAPEADRNRILDDAPIDLEIYLPSYITGGGKLLREVERSMSEYIRKTSRDQGIPERRSELDSWRFKRLDTAPPCTAIARNATKITRRLKAGAMGRGRGRESDRGWRSGKALCAARVIRSCCRAFRGLGELGELTSGESPAPSCGLFPRAIPLANSETHADMPLAEAIFQSLIRRISTIPHHLRGTLDIARSLFHTYTLHILAPREENIPPCWKHRSTSASTTSIFAMIATRAPTSLLRLAAPAARLSRALPVCRGLQTSTRLAEERTPLYDFHVAKQAKMVPFAGYSMPLAYGDVGQAHNHVRTAAGLFDVSHMLQHRFTGPTSQAFLMSLTPSSLNTLAPFTSTLSVLLNESGGIIDDTIITKQKDENEWYVVTNAGRAAEDVAHIKQKLDEWNVQNREREVRWRRMKGWGLLALQGPKSVEVLQGLVDKDMGEMSFGKSVNAKIGDVAVHIARGGYTGEDGFEISIPPESTVKITELITQQPGVELIGLGARDSLRLEAGMCLYGHDLDESVSPVEGGLTWVIGKDRRNPDAPNPFPGQSRILDEIAKGPSRRRVGFEVTGAPAREGCKIFDEAGTEEIGVITSGIPSPTLGTNIAMGYIRSGHHKKGTKVQIEVRRKKRDAVVKPMPFVPSKYYKGKGVLGAPA